MGMYFELLLGNAADFINILRGISFLICCNIYFIMVFGLGVAMANLTKYGNMSINNNHVTISS